MGRIRSLIAFFIEKIRRGTKQGLLLIPIDCCWPCKVPVKYMTRRPVARKTFC